MNDAREIERHNKVLEQISNAKTIEELPKIGLSSITGYLSTNIYFGDKKISATLFQPLANLIILNAESDKIQEEYNKVISGNYPEVSKEDAQVKYEKIVNSIRIKCILEEISQKSIKLEEIEKQDNLNKHRDIISKINSATEIKDLPKVGLSELNKKIVKAVNSNSYKSDFKSSDLKELTDAYLTNSLVSKKETIIKKIVDSLSLSEEDKIDMKNQIVETLFSDESINYVVDEINAKESKKLKIYKTKHEEIMENIKRANRISELPQGLTISAITSYLSGNATIYTSDNRITSEDLKTLSDLLLNNHKWEDQEVIDEIKKITSSRYPDKTDAFDLLYSKFKALPKTKYIVEEVRYSQERQVEFIGRGSSNVNVYFVPNSKSPEEGGRFYNCYINRVGKLDLSTILPLNLDEIVSPDTDIDEVEEIVQKVDPTFKTAGAIILNRDETIGDVSIFRPNDGKVGVSLEEKERIEKIDNLDAEIDDKKTKVESLDKEIEEKTNRSNELEAKMKKVLLDYEKKALALQAELMRSISELKLDAGIDNEGLDSQSPEGKGLK